MAEEKMLDRATYKKIKSMTREEMQIFLTNYYQNAVKDAERTAVNLENLRSALSEIKGVWEKRLDEIMTVIQKFV